MKVQKGVTCLANLVLVLFAVITRFASADSAAPSDSIIEFLQNDVQVLRAGSKTWDVASTNKPHNVLYEGDELRTGTNSRVGLRVPSQKAVLILDSNSRVILPSKPKGGFFELLKGRLFNLHRGPSGEQRFKTPTVSAIVRGTDFSLSVETDGATVVRMLVGEVMLENEFGHVSLSDGEEAIVKIGRPPQRTAMVDAHAAVQWCLYYPAVLDPVEIPFSEQERVTLKISLTSYAAGDLLHALAALPVEGEAISRAELLYRASLLLAVGNLDDAERRVASIKSARLVTEQEDHIDRLAAVLSQMIAVVSLQNPPPITTQLASELLVESYRLQSKGQLEPGLASALQATEKDPNFSFAWVRVAELEFGFGRWKEAETALAHSLGFAFRNPQAIALKGFMLLAQNRIDEAIHMFDRAIALDGKLANGWLGRGLARFRKGQKGAAIDDLQMAAAVEPQRALLRSYLGKARSERWEDEKALDEIAIAQHLDPNDPTAWLYSGLARYRQNRVNEAVADVQRSKELNDNRSLFRSRLLLDQDLAVRGVNLAALYRDAGLRELSLREATVAVDADYANYSAHLFLAESYDSLRDPRQVNLRYETPWFNELLLANLLAPVGVGSLSQNISQQEYSKMLQADGLGMSSTTEYASSGDWREAGSIFGAFGKTSFAVDSYYAFLNGDRQNDELEQRTIYGKLKHQVTAQDTVFAQIIQYENTSGDVRQYYDPSHASSTLRFKEVQDPNIYLGLHREWGAEHHTLLLAARLQDRIKLVDSNAAFPAFSAASNSPPTFGTFLRGFGQTYDSELTAYSAELQHIWQSSLFTVVAGARAQTGDVDAKATETFDPNNFPPEFFGTTNARDSKLSQEASAGLNRYTGYIYSFANLLPSVQMSAGLSYDHLVFPRNLELPPLADGERSKGRLSPKVGLRWNIAKRTNLRGVYTRSLGGTYYDTSVRLEPSQLSGFNQVFRSLAPESVAGSISGSTFETWGIGFDQQPTSTTYFGLGIENLSSHASRSRGAFDFYPPARATQYQEQLDFKEVSLVTDINQMVGKEIVIGTRYRLSQARLKTRFPGLPQALPTDGTFFRNQNLEAILHEVNINAFWNHHSGLFASFQASFYAQHSSGYPVPLADTDFWQLNADVGYRFLQRRIEARLGLWNILDQDYRLNPLNIHATLRRDRTLYARLRFNF